uniref:Mediator of RNA polymerase II transcription subunit 23 n=1 Tax=Tetranychus urticae TaxID=32264 RepID=T1KM15_TETUR
MTPGIETSRSLIRRKGLNNQCKYCPVCPAQFLRSVCEAILNCEHLHFNKQIFFCQSFELIHRVISQVDYKGVRDIIRFMIEKIHTIPIEANIAMLPQLDVMRKVLDYALNRNSSVLPAYLAFDEIKKKSDKWMHWKFADLFSAFVESFRPVAQMVSIINRSKLLPIVGYSSTLNQSWQLNAATAAFDLKGLLPYNNELTRPQIGLLRYVLEQPYSREMIYFMLSLTNKAKSRCPILEEQLVALIVLAMEKSENETNNQEETDYSQTQCLWQILSGHLITFIILNHISFPQLVRSLHESLAARNSKKGRDHLMWMLLQYISGSIQKTPLTDFLPFFKLHDLLYPEKDPLTGPDITKPICTHTFAISSIWIHLLKKAENEPQKVIRPIHVEFLHQTFMSTKALSSHLRILVDYLVNEFTNLCGTQNVTKYIDKLNDLIWKSHVITLDRLLLCLTLRAYEGNEAQVSLFFIQMLLLKRTDFSNRVADFVREMSPEHWKQSNWHRNHHALHIVRLFKKISMQISRKILFRRTRRYQRSKDATFISANLF